MADVNNRMAPISQPTTDRGYGDTSVSCLDGRIVEVLNEKQLTVAIAGKKETHLQTYERIKDFSTGFFSKGFWKSIGLVLSNLLAGKTLFGHTFGYSEKVVNANTTKNLDVSRKTTNLSNILDAVASTGSRGANTFADAVSWVAEGKQNPVGIVAARANAADPADRSVTRDKRYSENLPKLAKVIAQAAYSSPEHANAADKSHQLVASVRVALTAHAAFRNEDGVDTERLARTIMDFNGLVAAELAEQKLLAMVEADEAPTTIAGVVDAVKQASQEAGLHTQDASTQIKAVLSKMTDATSELGQALAPTLDATGEQLANILEGLKAISPEALTLPRIYTAEEKAHAVATAEALHEEMTSLLNNIQSNTAQMQANEKLIQDLGDITKPVQVPGKPKIALTKKVVDGEEVSEMTVSRETLALPTGQLQAEEGLKIAAGQIGKREELIARLRAENNGLLTANASLQKALASSRDSLNLAVEKLEDIEIKAAELKEVEELRAVVDAARDVCLDFATTADLFADHESIPGNYQGLVDELNKFSEYFAEKLEAAASEEAPTGPLVLSTVVRDDAPARVIRSQAAMQAAIQAETATDVEPSAEEIAKVLERATELQSRLGDYSAKENAFNGLKAYANSQQDKRDLNAAADSFHIHNATTRAFTGFVRGTTLMYVERKRDEAITAIGNHNAKKRAFRALDEATAPGIALTRRTKAVEEQIALAKEEMAASQARIAQIQGLPARRRAVQQRTGVAVSPMA